MGRRVVADCGGHCGFKSTLKYFSTYFPSGSYSGDVHCRTYHVRRVLLIVSSRFSFFFLLFFFF